MKKLALAACIATSFVAGGAQADQTGNYSVSINFALAESWRYVASSSCTINLTYLVNAQ